MQIGQHLQKTITICQHMSCWYLLQNRPSRQSSSCPQTLSSYVHHEGPDKTSVLWFHWEALYRHLRYDSTYRIHVAYILRTTRDV